MKRFFKRAVNNEDSSTVNAEKPGHQPAVAEEVPDEEYNVTIDESLTEIKKRTYKWLIWETIVVLIVLPLILGLGNGAYYQDAGEAFNFLSVYYQFLFTNWFMLLLIPVFFIGPAKIGMTKRKMAVSTLMQLAKKAGFNVETGKDFKKAEIFKKILADSREANRYYYFLGLMEKFWFLLGIFMSFVVIMLYVAKFTNLWQNISLPWYAIVYFIAVILGITIIFSYIIKKIIDYSLEEIRFAISRAIAQYEIDIVSQEDVTRGTQIQV
ncbi:MAG TPA: hypothetical protein PLK76_01900 [bacterium]|nr:hypothetical protein [bacterium]